MLGSKRKYGYSSQHIVMAAKNLDSFGIDLRYPLGCLELSSLDLGIEGSGVFFRVIHGKRPAGAGGTGRQAPPTKSLGCCDLARRRQKSAGSKSREAA